MRNRARIGFVAMTGAAIGLAGCGMRPQGAIPPPQPVLMEHNYSPPVANVFDWHSVPVGQRVPVENAAFDQEGYRLATPDGTIVVPFANQNLYVMKFARSFSGGSYFENQGSAPVLYLANGFGLANAAAQGAMWYPLPPSYQPANPVYVGLAPSWGEYRSMGWYPGMMYYGGLYSPYYQPGMIFHSWTPGFIVNIGGRPYTNYRSYSNYYHTSPGYARVASGGAVYTQPRAARYVSHSGGTGGGFGGSATGNRGSFGAGNRSFGSPGFGSARPRSSFGSGSPTYHNTPRTGGSFGSGGRTYNSGASGSGSTRSPGGGSFGRSGGFGGSSSGRRSSGGGSFGGGRRR